ncbi:MAG: LytR C-terminal domain-containing protein [Bacteroidetes bacterium]|nr:LytR C-terminal domain-containing protein [Bacteroidota bacterium]
MKIKKDRHKSRIFVLILSLVGISIFGIVMYIFAHKEHTSSLKDHHSTALIDASSAPEIEVLDATGISKYAVSIVYSLRSRGYDVVEFRKVTNEPIDMSHIIVYKNCMKEAQAIATLLGISPSRVFQVEKSKVDVDISIVLGKDCKKKQNQMRRSF